MKNKTKRNKIQFIIEDIFFLAICFIMLLLFFKFPLAKNIVKVCILLSFIAICIFEILKFKGKWFKSKCFIPKGIKFILSITAVTVVHLSYEKAIPQIYGIIYPPALIALFSFIDYKLIFNNNN